MRKIFLLAWNSAFASSPGVTELPEFVSVGPACRSMLPAGCLGLGGLGVTGCRLGVCASGLLGGGLLFLLAHRPCWRRCTRPETAVAVPATTAVRATPRRRPASSSFRLSWRRGGWPARRSRPRRVGFGLLEGAGSPGPGSGRWPPAAPRRGAGPRRTAPPTRSRRPGFQRTARLDHRRRLVEVVLIQTDPRRRPRRRRDRAPRPCRSPRSRPPWPTVQFGVTKTRSRIRTMPRVRQLDQQRQPLASHLVPGNSTTRQSMGPILPTRCSRSLLSSVSRRSNQACRRVIFSCSPTAGSFPSPVHSSCFRSSAWTRVILGLRREQFGTTTLKEIDADG